MWRKANNILLSLPGKKMLCSQCLGGILNYLPSLNRRSVSSSVMMMDAIISSFLQIRNAILETVLLVLKKAKTCDRSTWVVHANRDFPLPACVGQPRVWKHKKRVWSCVLYKKYLQKKHNGRQRCKATLCQFVSFLSFRVVRIYTYLAVVGSNRIKIY